MVDPIAAITTNGTGGKIVTAALSVVVAGLLFFADKLWNEKEEMQAAHVDTQTEMSALQSTVAGMKDDNERLHETLESTRDRLVEAQIAAAKSEERLEGARERLQRVYESIRDLDGTLQREMRDLDQVAAVELDGLGTRLQDEIAARERLTRETILALAAELREALRGLEREVFGGKGEP